MNFIYLAFNIKVNLSQLIKMLNGNQKMIIGKDSNIRKLLCYAIYILHYRMACFKNKNYTGYSFKCTIIWLFY